MSKGTSVLPRKRPVVQKAKEVPQEAPVKGSALTLVIIVSVLFVLLSGAYNLVTPASTLTATVQHPRDGGSPNADELAHVQYVQSMATGHLPVFSNKSADYEAHQPPLYYAIDSIAYKAAPANPEQRIHWLRWISTLLGVGLIWAIYYGVKEILPSRQAISATVIIAALLPMNVSLSSSVSNDTLSNLIFVLYLVVVGCLLRKPAVSVRAALLLALVIGAGIWTKSTEFLLIPLTAVVLIYGAWNRSLTWKSSLLDGFVSIGGALLISAPWLLRNEHFYGDPFATSVIFHDLASRNVEPYTLISYFGASWYIQRFFGWTFASYWGVFDSMTLFLPVQIYYAAAVAALVTVTTGAFTLGKKLTSNVMRTNLAGWLALTLLTLLAYVQYNQHFFQLQGRYLYPALLPLSAASAMGLSKLLGEKYETSVLTALTVSFVLLNIYCLSMLSGRYA